MLAIAAGAVLVCALAIRLAHLERAPLWSDELFTLTYPRLGLRYMWTDGMRVEPTSPVYYSVIWMIEHLGGRSAFWLRLPSVIGSLMAVALTWALALEISGSRMSALIACAIFAIAPESVFFAQEARTYALQTAALALALFGLACFLRLRARNYPLVLYAAGANLAIYLHPTSVVAVAAINAAALLAAVGPHRLLAGGDFRRWCITNLVVALFCAPLALTITSPQTSDAVSWIPAINRWWLEKLAGLFLAGPAMSDVAMQVAELGVPLLALLMALSGWRPSRRATMVVVVVPCMFLAAMILISLKRPILLDRTIAWLWVPLAVMLGDAMSRRLKATSVVLIGGLMVLLSIQQMHAGQLVEDWHFLGQLPPRPGSALVILGPRTPAAAIDLYAPNLEPLMQGDDGRPQVAETMVAEQTFHLPKISLADVRIAIASGQPVYLIYRQPDHLWVEAATDLLPPPILKLQDTSGLNPAARALVW